MNRSGTKARAKRKAFICGRPSYICACRIFIYKGTSGLIFFKFLIFVRKRWTKYKKAHCFCLEDWAQTQGMGRVSNATRAWKVLLLSLLACWSRTQVKFSKLLDSSTRFMLSHAGLNQLGFSRKRCSPHCAYSSSVEILTTIGRELCQVPMVFPKPQNYIPQGHEGQISRLCLQTYHSGWKRK